jgi:hypothetical protein
LDEINQRLRTCISGLIALAVVALIGFIVWVLAAVDPLEIAGVLTATGAALAILPSIIKAMRGAGQ